MDVQVVETPGWLYVIPNTNGPSGRISKRDKFAGRWTYVFEDAGFAVGIAAYLVSLGHISMAKASNTEGGGSCRSISTGARPTRRSTWCCTVSARPCCPTWNGRG